jgi:hypothetical protein
MHLGFSAENPLKGRLTFQSAEESFERGPDRNALREPAALSAALISALDIRKARAHFVSRA